MTTAKFDNLFVLGRPAGGKSEFIDFMKHVSDNERIEKFCIGKFEEIDDFPWLDAICREDDAREAKGEQRLYSEKQPEGYNITVPKFRSNLIPKFNEKITQKYTNNPSFYKDGTLLIEFARGITDGFKESLDKFEKSILQNAAILYIKVSFEESYRKNDKRYREGLEDSILYHKVPDKDMYGFFKENDWDAMTEGKEFGYLTLNGVKVPFVAMNNEPESTDPVVLNERYGKALKKLMELKD